MLTTDSCLLAIPAVVSQRRGRRCGVGRGLRPTPWPVSPPPLSSPALSTSATTSHTPLLWESQAPLSQLLHFYLCHPCKSPGPKLDLPKLGLLPFARPDGSFQVQSQAPRPKLSAQSPSRCSLVAKQHLWSSVFSCHMTIVAKETSPLASRDTARLRQRCVT